GIDFLLRAMRDVVAREPRVRLLVGGTGTMRLALEQFAHDHGLIEHVEFLGFVPDADLPRLYQRAGCVVVPSVFEGFGIPVLEAMACGATVVGTNVDGIRSLIEDGVTGLLADYGDEPGLADRILRVCRGEFAVEPALADRVRADFDWSVVARRYDEVFRRVVSE
ncbi:MAG: glycosyltransferase family 4 protein, partial [Planctomycetes bacterium]|nr:glycosyltransferase family 4 protein [Planctomycetota bacterium]